MFQQCTSLSIGRTSETGRLCEPDKAFHWIVLILCVLAVTVSLLLRHDGDGLRLFGIRWPVSCALYENFGVRCALCGLTRSFCAMAAGEWSAAMHFHLLGPVIFVFVCLQIPYRIHALWSTRPINGMLRRIGMYVSLGLAGGLLINWLVYLGGRIG
ncbi:MAG: DUF2752 domain-containing protein [Sedimentisphaerales bacterium]|nr:DUF2752 domain-containing protein [Sedimentisphaerales bacterium]